MISNSMTPPPPPHQPKTFLGQLTQAVQTIQGKVNFQALALKPNARVPELWVQEAGAAQAEIYSLLGDRYLLGRSSKSCDIVVRNPVVSQTHLSINREGRRRSHFVIRDENSTNGIYRGRRRINALELQHNDVLTIGPPELADSVRLQFYYPPPWYVQVIRYSLYGAGGLIAILALAIGIEWLKPELSVYPLAGATGPVVVYADDGETPLRQPRSEAHVEMRQLQDFSPVLPKALMASEDSRYYWHLGIDPIGTLRAISVNVRGKGIRQGGSTITQQLARSLFRDYVGREDSLGRKVREAVVALKLETFYSKDQLLLTYLNRVYLGVDTYGFEDAARYYFGKSAKQLNIAESATLVGMLPAPNLFNPCQDPTTSLKQRNLVIGRMISQGWISQDEGADARRSPMQVYPGACDRVKNTKAPYFYNYVFSELEELLGTDVASEGNFIIETGINLPMQQQAETVLRQTIKNSGAGYGFSQGAIVTLDFSTGEIRALVGGEDYQKSQFDRATRALRQPGSTFKIFTYTAALEKGISPDQSYSCDPLVWQGQRFRGCEHGASGTANMYQGMALSENPIALRIAQDVGLENVVKMAQRFGITSPLKAVPGLVLGQSEVTALELTGAFGAIANQGLWHHPHTIKRILDSSKCQDRSQLKTCRVVYSFAEDKVASKQVISPAIAATMTDLLRGVVQSGTGKNASLGRGEAGKTGTTNSGVDLWFVGYLPNPQLVTGIWLGNDDPKPSSASSAQAAQVWGNYMRQIIR